jgi:hypothetical protein
MRALDELEVDLLDHAAAHSTIGILAAAHGF